VEVVLVQLVFQELEEQVVVDRGELTLQIVLLLELLTLVVEAAVQVTLVLQLLEVVVAEL
tara:strand:- start:19 stop:198 length:180 start_codon:yes stop_codon:yes gene_type:complete